MAKDYLKEVEKLRGEIVAAREELDWLGDAQIPVEELKARATEQVRALSAKFEAKRRLGALAYPNAGAAEVSEMLRLSTRTIINGDGGARLGVINIDDHGPLFAWLMCDVLIARMHAEIDQLGYVAGPPVAERPARRRALREELRKLEISEEKLIVAAEEAGMFIPRRVDADPAVVLDYDPAGTMPDEAGPRPVQHPGLQAMQAAQSSRNGSSAAG